MSSQDDNPSLARNLGRFFGEIVRAINTDVSAPQTRKQLSHTIETASIDVDQYSGQSSKQVTEELIAEPTCVIVRRTTIEQIRIDRPRNTQPASNPDDSPDPST
jgi:hypothetical protein